MTVRSLLLILPVLALTGCVQQANRDDKVLVQQAELGFDSCGFLEVPEDYSVLEGRRIKIAYCILKAKGSNNSKVPLIICTGGPGSAAISGVVRWADHPFRDTHDIILFDQRGVGLSGALPSMGSALFDILAADLNLSEEFTAIHDTLMLYKSQIEATGVDIGSYNTRNNATDVNAIMNHLNYPQYILYGESYGTKLVRTVLDVYPEKIKSVILDSPAIPENDFLLMRLQNLSNALEAIFQFCSKDSACNALTPDLREDFLAGAKSLETKPIHIQVDGKPFVINPQDALYLLRYQLYTRAARSTVPEFISNIKTGNILKLSESLEAAFGIFELINFSMFLAVETYDEVDVQLTVTDINNYHADELRLPASLALFTSLRLSASDWGARSAESTEMMFSVSTVPALIFVNAYDPATPPAYARAYQKTLPNSILYVLDQWGHGVGSTCAERVMASFARDSISSVDVSCLPIVK